MRGDGSDVHLLDDRGDRRRRDIRRWGVSTYPLSVSVKGSGKVTGHLILCGTTLTVCYANQPANSTVTLTAAAIAGATFRGWGGACSGTQDVPGTDERGEDGERSVQRAAAESDAHAEGGGKGFCGRAGRVVREPPRPAHVHPDLQPRQGHNAYRAAGEAPGIPWLGRRLRRQESGLHRPVDTVPDGHGDLLRLIAAVGRPGRAERLRNTRPGGTPVASSGQAEPRHLRGNP